MRYLWMDDYLLRKRGVTKDLQAEWNWIRYQIGGRMFAAVCLDDCDRPYYINLKLEPQEGEFFRGQYPDILPGYYSNKRHWNSVRADGAVPDELLKGMLDRSYRLVLAGFSRQRQREILGLSSCGADCAACACYGGLCAGCTQCQGRVFHAPAGRACPLYACAVQRKRRVSCAGCPELPCALWRQTRDPQLSDAEFEASLAKRVQALQALE